MGIFAVFALGPLINRQAPSLGWLVGRAWSWGRERGDVKPEGIIMSVMIIMTRLSSPAGGSGVRRCRGNCVLIRNTLF